MSNDILSVSFVHNASSVSMSYRMMHILRYWDKEKKDLCRENVFENILYAYYIEFLVQINFINKAWP